MFSWHRCIQKQIYVDRWAVWTARQDTEVHRKTQPFDTGHQSDRKPQNLHAIGNLEVLMRETKTDY